MNWLILMLIVLSMVAGATLWELVRMVIEHRRPDADMDYREEDR
jgi:hypothetical protein